MSYLSTLIDAGQLLSDLADEQAEWSQKTFGTDQMRGPIGALRHLEKEAREAQEHPGDAMEYADCFLLILDAARRAGIKPMELMRHAEAKMKINKGSQVASAKRRYGRRALQRIGKSPDT